MREFARTRHAEARNAECVDDRENGERTHDDEDGYERPRA
jgi:hypothetical protein